MRTINKLLNPPKYAHSVTFDLRTLRADLLARITPFVSRVLLENGIDWYLNALLDSRAFLLSVPTF